MGGIHSSRDPLWVAVVDAMKAAASYKPPPSEVLSTYIPRSDGSRTGGLYLAKQSAERERRTILRIFDQTPSISATLVSDGAKLSTRKRGMLNSSMVAQPGMLFLQSTDATGKTKVSQAFHAWAMRVNMSAFS